MFHLLALLPLFLPKNNSQPSTVSSKQTLDANETCGSLCLAETARNKSTVTLAAELEV